jgi:extracellular factor (EF) 3-hydroxypalmitic acid methyl ester biosynthesis protein
MYNERFFDQTLDMINAGAVQAALPMLAGKLYSAHADPARWKETRASLHRHALHAVLLQDPFTAHSASRPRGYPGDAGLIDLIYDMQPPTGVSELGREIFDVTIKFQAPEGVRQRRIAAERLVADAHRSGQRVLALACGHFREGDPLVGQDMSQFTLVDQDGLSLDRVCARHGTSIEVHEANVFRFLRRAAHEGQRFDLIYTLGLTDYLDDPAMALFHKLMKACLAPQGRIVLANFAPNHLGTGWMDAVMDWQLIYREEAELKAYAEGIGLAARTWRDPTDSVAWCEMSEA